MPLYPPVASLALVAATSDSGYALVNGTGTILSWTAPNDGKLHTVHVVSAQVVTSNESGGAITLNTTLPNGTAVTPTAYAGGSTTGTAMFSTDRIVEPGSTTSLVQSSALTVGAAALWAQIWGE